MSLFKPAKNESAFLKLGLMGSTGSGKTFTACLVAAGVVQMLRERRIDYAAKPVMFIDSENGSDYVGDLFEEAGIELMVAKTKSFKDLCTAIREAEREASFLIIDSVSAFWDEWKSSYQKAKGRTRLQFEDFAAIKSGWRDGFTDRLINSKLHIAMCGRMAYEYDYTVDEDTGKKNLEKTDVKMAAEKELGYETSLFVLMERDNDLKTMKQVRTATVLKDRFRVLDGEAITNPSFKSFAPHIEKLNLGGTHSGVDLSRSSVDMVPLDPKRDNTSIRRKIVIDELDALLLEHGASGTSGEAKTKRATLVKEHFKTVSKTEIEELMPLADLQSSYDSLHRALTGHPSRYGVKEQAPDTPDEILFLGDSPAEKAAAVAQTPAAAPAQADAPAQPGPASSPEYTTKDPRDALCDRILSAIDQSFNRTGLEMVIKANARHREALAEEHAALIDAAIGKARARVALAAKPTAKPTSTLAEAAE